MEGWLFSLAISSGLLQPNMRRFMGISPASAGGFVHRAAAEAELLGFSAMPQVPVERPMERLCTSYGPPKASSVAKTCQDDRFSPQGANLWLQEACKILELFLRQNKL